MRKMAKNSKAMLCAISLVFLGFAGADASFDHQTAGIVSAGSRAPGVHATLHRASMRTRKAHAVGLVAVIPSSSFSPSFLHAGPVLRYEVSNFEQSSQSGPSARAPPIS